MATWTPEWIERLARTDEVDILTARPDGGERRTTIWVVVADSAVFVRSVRGSRGAWYRDMVATGSAGLEAAAATIQIIARRADDPRSVQLVSEALEAKYGRRARASTDSMLEPETLATTTQLEPAGGDD